MTIPHVLYNPHNHPTTIKLYTLEYTDFDQTNVCYDCFTIIYDFFGIGYHNHTQQLDFELACNNNLITLLNDNIPIQLPNNYQHIYDTVCGKGFLNVIIWLHKNYPTQSHPHRLTGFKEACKNNCINVLNWMYKTFTPDMPNFFLDNMYECVGNAYNNVETLKWLNKFFEKNFQIMNAHSYYGFSKILSPSQLPVLDYLNNLLSDDLIENAIQLKLDDIFYYGDQIETNTPIINWFHLNHQNRLHEYLKEQPFDVLLNLIYSEQITLIKWLYNIYPKIIIQQFMNSYERIIETCCRQHNVVGALNFLHSIFSTIIYNLFRNNGSKYFREACQNDNTPMINWIITNIGKPQIEQYFKQNNYKSFFTVIDVNTITLLAKTFPTLIDNALKATNYITFHNLCKQKTQPTILNNLLLKLNHNSLIISICKAPNSKYLPTLIYLHKYHPTQLVTHLKQNNYEAFKRACIKNNISILNYFKTHYPTQTLNAYKINNYKIFVKCCNDKKTKTVLWMITNFTNEKPYKMNKNNRKFTTGRIFYNTLLQQLNRDRCL